MKKCSLLFIICTCVMIVTSCIKQKDESYIEYVRVGNHLPSFTVALNTGDTIDTSRIKGKGLVLVFFNTTCQDCQRELPKLNARYLAHELPDGTNGDGWQYVCISREQDSVSVADYWHAHSLSLPYSAQTDRRIFSMFASAGIPRVYVADSTGVVLSMATSL